MNAAIITAAGKGIRLKGDINKQFMLIHNKPILAHTLKSFQECQKIDEIYVVIPKEYMDYCRNEIIKKYAYNKIAKLIAGGASRQESVYKGLLALPQTCSLVSVHDGVRPLITAREIGELIEKLLLINKNDDKYKGIITASPAYETVKKIDPDNNIESTITRSQVCIAQTPQTFFYSEIIQAYEKAIKDGFAGTDDASLIERMGWKVKVIMGHHENIKITTPMDLFLAELIMSKNGKSK